MQAGALQVSQPPAAYGQSLAGHPRQYRNQRMVAIRSMLARLTGTRPYCLSGPPVVGCPRRPSLPRWQRELFWQLPIELVCQRKEGAMHLHTFRDENHSRHFDLIGHNWSIDLVTVAAAGILVVGFACALVALLVH